jgi:hypothetical protein
MTGLVAHAGGTGWDELIFLALPVVVLVVLQMVGRRRRSEQDEAPTGQDEEVERDEAEG